jgi:hypothetical protein
MPHGAGNGELTVSTNNISNVQVTDGGLSVLVTFKTHGGKGQRTYLYSSLEAVKGILNGDDPATWSGVQVDDGGGGSVSDGGAGKGAVGATIENAVTDIAEIGEL